MSPLEKAERIITLHKAVDSLTARLAAIDLARKDGTAISIKFKIKNRNNNSWGDIDGVAYERFSHTAGDLGDIASVVLARMSDEVARKKRQAEFELRSLEEPTR